MNQLSLEKRVQVINLLVEGNSMRATSRITNVAFNTVRDLLIEVGQACQKFHEEKVVNIKSKRVQCDETWSFVYAKEKNVNENMRPGSGSSWVWIGLDSETKLVISYFAGNRDAESASTFMMDLESRLKNRMQLTTDGLVTYLEAVEEAFEGNVDYAQLVKIYGKPERDGKVDNRRQYIGSDRTVICGSPDKKYISTSHIERQNLTMRMHMRRFTRKTNAFSKKIENHRYAIALHFVYYNFVRIHQTLRVTPAMEAGLINHLMELEDIVNLTKRYPGNSN